MADKSKNDKNNKKGNKDRDRDEEQNSGSQGGRSSYNQGESKKDSWSMEDESMDDE